MNDSPDNKESSPDLLINIGISDNNLRILYITFAVIIGLLLLWVIVIYITKDNPIKILTEMNNLSLQIKPIIDDKIIESEFITDQTIISTPDQYTMYNDNNNNILPPQI